MSHRLSPVVEGQFLEPIEIVRRLRAEFEFVEADSDAGTEVIADMIKQFERMKAPNEMIDLYRSMLGQAIRVVFADREDFQEDYIDFTAIPMEKPLIAYHSRQHEDAASNLLARTCKILRYKAELV